MLILLSAGSTIAEEDKTFLGQGDSPFSDAGKEQLLDVTETLSTYKLDKVYSSDLYRAQETLRAVLSRQHADTDYEFVEELRERSGGSYEGKKYADIRKGMSPRQYKVWERDPFEAPEHGESLIDVEQKLKPWWEAVVEPLLQENKNVLIISHVDTLKVLVCLARGDDITHSVEFKSEHGMPYFYYPTSK